MSLSSAALILAWVAIVLLSLGTVGLFRHLQLLTESDLAASDRENSRGHSSEGFGLSPRSKLTDCLGERPLFVLFTKQSCVSCHRLVDQISKTDLASENTTDLDLALVSDSTCPNELGSSQPVLCIDHAASEFELLRIPATPWLMVIDSDGIVQRSGAVGSLEAYLSMFDRASWYDQKVRAQ